jgi:HEAT repeat protein
MLLAALAVSSPADARMPVRDDVSTSDRAWLYGPIAFERVVAERIDKPGDSSDDLLRALVNMRQQAHVPLLIRSLRSPNERIRTLAISGLSDLAEMFPQAPWRRSAAVGLRPLLTDKDARIAAIKAIGLTGGAEDVPALLALAEQSFAKHAGDEGSTSSETATLIEALGHLRDPRAAPLLHKILAEPRRSFGAKFAAAAAGLALARMGDRTAIPLLQKRLEGREVRALLALEELGDKTSGNLVRKLLEADVPPSGNPDAALTFKVDEAVRLAEGTYYLATQDGGGPGTAESRRILRAALDGITSGKRKLFTVVHSGAVPIEIRRETMDPLLLFGLASLGDAAAEGALRRAMTEGEMPAPRQSSSLATSIDLRRMTAAWGWLKLGRPGAWDEVARAVRAAHHQRSYGGVWFTDTAFRTRVAMVQAAQKAGSPEALRYLIQVLADDNINLSLAAQRALQAFPDQAAVKKALRDLLRNGDEYDRSAAAETLVLLGREGTAPLVGLAGDRGAPGQASAYALRALTILGVPEAEAARAAAANDARPEVMDALAWAEKLKKAQRGEQDRYLKRTSPASK